MFDLNAQCFFLPVIYKEALYMTVINCCAIKG